MKHLFETSLIQIQLWKDTRMDLQSIYYIICLSHSVWMSLSLFLSLSQSLLSGNSSVCFLSFFFFSLRSCWYMLLVMKILTEPNMRK